MHHSHSAVHCVTKLSGFLDWIVSEAGAVFYHNVSVWFWIVYGLKITKIFCCQWYLGCKQQSLPVLRLSHEDDISTNVRWFCQNKLNNILQGIALLCPLIYANTYIFSKDLKTILDVVIKIIWAGVFITTIYLNHKKILQEHKHTNCPMTPRAQWHQEQSAILPLTTVTTHRTSACTL